MKSIEIARNRLESCEITLDVSVVLSGAVSSVWEGFCWISFDFVGFRTISGDAVGFRTIS